MIKYLKNAGGLASCAANENVCWINVECPSSEDKDYLVNSLQIPVSFYNDIEDMDERPRIEVEDDWILIVLRIPLKTDDESLPFITVPLGLIFKDEIVVSVCFYQTEMINDFIHYTNRKNVEVLDCFDLALKLLLSSSVWYLKYLKQVNQKIKMAEKHLETSIRNEDLQTLMRLEKSLVYFTTSLKGNDILTHKIKNFRKYKDTFDPELVEDVEIELRQAQETTNIYSDILNGTMDAYASVISNNLNVIMKQLTSVSIILMIPTLIASLYGMNVPNMFQNNNFGFYIVLFISFLLAAMGILLFKWKKWF
jgi:magnesium transporter